MKKKLVSMLLAMVLLVSLSVPAFAADRDWESAYASIVQSSKDMLEYQLVDLDLNGVPELLVGYIPGTMLTTKIAEIYTFRDGKAQKLNMNNSANPDSYIYCLGWDYEFYRNSAGDLKVEAHTPFRSGWAYNNTTWLEYTLSRNTLDVTATYIHAHKTDSAYKESEEYQIGQNTVSQSAWQSSFDARHNGWTKIEGVGFATAANNTGKKMTNGAVQKFFDDYKDGSLVVSTGSQNITVNGAPVSIGAYAIDGYNYFKLRDIAAVLNQTGSQFEVGWDGAANSISLTTGKGYTTVGGELTPAAGGNQIGKPNASSIYIDGSPADLTAYTINENNYFKLRDLGEVLNFDVDWDGDTQTVRINSK